MKIKLIMLALCFILILTTVSCNKFIPVIRVREYMYLIHQYISIIPMLLVKTEKRN